jgi:hypothetical protein
MPRHHHILPAASNLLGIALVIITGLNVSGIGRHSISDEIAWFAALALSLACLLSYIAIRAEPRESRSADWADRIFFGGLVLLFAAVAALAVSL